MKKEQKKLSEKIEGKFGIDELMDDCANLMPSELFKKLEKYKEIDRSVFLKNSPLDVFISKAYFHAIHANDQNAEKAILFLQNLGDKFSDKMCLALLKKNINMDTAEIIDKYRKDFNYEKYFNEIHSSVDKKNWISVKYAFLIYNKYSTDYLERDTNLSCREIHPLIELLVEKCFNGYELQIFVKKITLNPKDKDLSIKTKNHILFKIFKNTSLVFDFDVFKYLLDTPGMDFEALEPLFLNRDEMTMESNFDKECRKKFKKVFNYFQAIRMNIETTSEFNL